MGQEKDKNPFFKPLYKALCGFLDCSGHQKRLGQLWNMGKTKTKCPSFPLLLGSTQQNSSMAYLALNSGNFQLPHSERQQRKIPFWKKAVDSVLVVEDLRVHV